MIPMRNHFFLLLLLSLMFSCIPIFSSKYDSMRQGISLSVENTDDVLTSRSGEFTAGFYPVGNNAYCFAVWFSQPSCSLRECTVVWMANRDEPVNGKHSKLTITKHGDAVLRDARRKRATVWSTNTASLANTSVELILNDIGNLVLSTTRKGKILWQSFDSPTDTLLPQQLLTRDTPLISSKSRGNYSSGYYKLYFDNDNVLRLLFDGPEISSVYWPDPSLLPWDADRTTYNDSRVAVLDIYGNFTSSDDLQFLSSDYGVVIQRILRIDFDGNVRLYSRSTGLKEWNLTWQLVSRPCQVHGICGPNSICSYNPFHGRSCSCLPGYERRSLTEWTLGCKSKFKSFCDDENVGADFIRLPFTDFYGYDKGLYPNRTLAECKKLCVDLCNCKGFQHKIDMTSGMFNCYPKARLLNGFQVQLGTIYLKLPKSEHFRYYETEEKQLEDSNLHCSILDITLTRTYTKMPENSVVRALLIFALAGAGLEIMVVLVVFCSLIWTRLDENKAKQDYQLAARRFRRYTYSELKAATKNFSKEIGRGATGRVYNAVLPEGKIGAVKRLNVASGGEEQFLAEVSTIGMLNHMHLIEMWGYCAEGKHRLLVYEFMEHGSLAENISSPELDWDKRFDIALGSAKGLEYLHEECLEWVLHCDVKPQNILLDSNYKPKVADFGLSKLLSRGVSSRNSKFSRIRGTRGYMAPEWVYNLSITSKVDVYSYGIVLLEMVTRKSPTGGGGDQATDWKQMTSWIREKKNGEESEIASWLREVVDPTIEGNFNTKKIEILVTVALQCMEEDRDMRPTMSQVVEMLLCNEDGGLQN